MASGQNYHLKTEPWPPSVQDMACHLPGLATGLKMDKDLGNEHAKTVPAFFVTKDSVKSKNSEMTEDISASGFHIHFLS